MGVSAGAWVVALLLVAGGGTAGALSADPAAEPSPVAQPSTPSPSPETLAVLDQAKMATVQLTTPCDDEDLSGCSYGSGSVVDSSGLILTNAHVAAPASPGLGGQYDELQYGTTNPPYLIVSVPPGPEEDAVPRYRASLVAVDGYADLAVVRIDADLDGNPLVPPPLPSVPIGSLEKSRNSSPVWVVGFPESDGSAAPSSHDGTLVSKPRDPRVAGPWELNTDAVIHSGNSGGLVIDAQGKLIAIPTYSQGFTERTYRARAVELAGPLIAAAQNGKPYLSPHLVERTGEEALVDVGWSGERYDECYDPGGEPTLLAPAELHAQVRLEGLAEGEDYRLVLTDPAGDAVASVQDAWRGEGCLQLSLPSASAADSGSWSLTVLVGPAWDTLGTASVEVFSSDEGEPDEGDS